jgi:hypothetical protein
VFSNIKETRSLEQDGQQPRFTRGRGAKRGAPRGGAGGNRREVDPSTRQCNTCEAFGHTWLECPKGNKIERDIATDRTLLSQRHFAEDVLRTFEMWDCIPALAPMKPGTRLTKDQSDPSPDLAFHRRYRGIVGSLGYLVNMTRPDLAWSYSEHSKYVHESWEPPGLACAWRNARGRADHEDIEYMFWKRVSGSWAAGLLNIKTNTKNINQIYFTVKYI